MNQLKLSDKFAIMSAILVVIFLVIGVMHSQTPKYLLELKMTMCLMVVSLVMGFVSQFNDK